MSGLDYDDWLHRRYVNIHTIPNPSRKWFQFWRRKRIPNPEIAYSAFKLPTIVKEPSKKPSMSGITLDPKEAKRLISKEKRSSCDFCRKDEKRCFKSERGASYICFECVKELCIWVVDEEAK